MSEWPDTTRQVMQSLRLSQMEFAAALDVRQPTVSRWLSGARTPPPPVRDQLATLVAAAEHPAVVLGHDSRGRPVVAPKTPWPAALRPRGRFRLPQHIEWSGTDRWRDATDHRDLLEAYALVLYSASVTQIVAWVPLQALSEHLNQIPIPRTHRPLWHRHLDEFNRASVG